MKPILLAGGFRFLEGPRWYDDAFYVSDMLAGSVFKIGSERRVELVAIVAERSSGLGFLPDGRLLIASMTDRKILQDTPSRTRRQHQVSCRSFEDYRP
jgi:sugar lactone lactonase YvrE